MVRIIALLTLLIAGYAGRAVAQQPPPPSTPASEPQEPTTFRERLKEPPDQGGGIHVTKHFAVVFGGIKSGSGAALGPAWSHKFENGAYTQVKALYSIRRFRLLQARYDSRRFWKARAIVVSRIRWQDAPKLSLFALGPDAPDLSVLYGERKTEGSARVRIQLAPAVRIASGFAIERYATSGGRLDLADDERLNEIPVMPGLGTNPWFAHTFFTAALDSRTAPDYSRTGRLLEATVRDYHDMHDGQDSFQRFEASAQQLVPTHGARGVVDLSAATWLSHSIGSSSVPFFIMPTLGGATYLLGYQSYRFRDRNALILRGEYRWAVHKMVDVAGVYEVGKVAPTVKGLALRDVAKSIAGGIRVHTKTSSLVNLDLAHSSDGFRIVLGFSSAGS
jgi:hypothetical protein